MKFFFHFEDRDVYFLDDPLSAVDPQIAKKIFDRCIRGILKNRTVILVTHRIRFLTEVDHLIYMKEGSVVASGKNSIQFLNNFYFFWLLQNCLSLIFKMIDYRNPLTFWLGCR